MMNFRTHIGVDYSGAGTPESHLARLQVYLTEGDTAPRRVRPLGGGNKKGWSRSDVANWIIERVEGEAPCLIGIDHAFSLPLPYFRRYRLTTWPGFLEDFSRHWPTHLSEAKVNDIRKNNPKRTGKKDEFRLTERWTSSAKSVFQFGVPGQVAPSTHAGIPWLYDIREQTDGRIHFWPFDGWKIPRGKPAIVEVYPSIFRNRYPKAKRTGDEQDAYSIARWLQETDQNGFLPRYLEPPLTEDELKIAELEGWILGVA